MADQAQPEAQQKPPFGSNPATGPTENKGYDAAAAQRLGLVVQQLQEILSTFGATTPVGRTVLEVLPKLVKHVPPGAVTPAAQQNNVQQLAMRNQQNAQQMMQLRAGQQQPQQQPQQQKVA